MTPATRPYYMLHEGKGGTFDFPLPTGKCAQPTYAIGTSGCRHCVGVYIPLSKTKCFAAHVVAVCDLIDDPNTPNAPYGPRIPTPSQGKALSDKVSDLLKDHVGDYQMHGKVASLLSKAIFVCPNLAEKPPDGDSEMHAVGKYIMDGFETYFTPTTFDVEKAHGFAVNHITSTRNIFLFEEQSDERVDEIVFEEEMQEKFQEIADERYGWEACNRADRRNGSGKAWLLKLRENGWQADRDDTLHAAPEGP